MFRISSSNDYYLCNLFHLDNDEGSITQGYEITFLINSRSLITIF